MDTRAKSFFSFSVLIIILAASGQITHAQPTPGLTDLVEPGEPELIATGFTFAEGPVWHPNGYLLFSDIPANKIYKWTQVGQVEIFRSPSGHSNGLTFDRQGRLITCEHGNRQVSRTEPDGTVVTLANNYSGKKLNSPWDSVVKSDNSIYFTDPPYGLTPAYGVAGMQELAFHGVYRIPLDGNGIRLLVDDISNPVGLVFSPDESVLYIGSFSAKCIYAFDVETDGTLANRRLFAYVMGSPVGMKVDIQGNLYVTTDLPNIQVYNSMGTRLGYIKIPESTFNCAFGGLDYKTLFITAKTSIYRVQLKVQGIPVIPMGN